MEEPTLSDINNTMSRFIEKIDKVGAEVSEIKTGLYGRLSDPGSGFINDTNTNLKSLDGKVKVLLNERQERKKDKKWTLRAALAATIGSIVALIKTFIFNGSTSP